MSTKNKTAKPREATIAEYLKNEAREWEENNAGIDLDEPGANDHYFEQQHERHHFVPEDGETDASRNL